MCRVRQSCGGLGAVRGAPPGTPDDGATPPSHQREEKDEGKKKERKKKRKEGGGGVGVGRGGWRGGERDLRNPRGLSPGRE